MRLSDRLVWKVCAAGAALAALIAVYQIVPARGQQYVNQAIRVVVNGMRVRFPDQQPITVNNRVLVPLRGVLEAMGARVQWNPANQTVIARRAGNRVELRVNSRDASLNGNPIPLDVPAAMYGGRVMVPLRFVSEALGGSVRWMDATQTARIRTSESNVPVTQPAPPAPAPTGEGGQTNAQTLFVENCGRCHHIGALGTGRISLANEGAKHTRDWIEVQIRTPGQHNSPMPAYPPSKLSDRDLHVISRYLANLT
ncbi:MAG TPA: stalk domain-containing protein [Armatimonadota bacterium]|nr:stalk domain-containing protein [Armatimonadota bacterium]